MLFTLATNLIYSVFLTTSFFTTSLSLLQSTRRGANLLISSLSTSVSTLAKFDFSAKVQSSTCDIFFKLVLLHNYISQL